MRRLLVVFAVLAAFVRSAQSEVTENRSEVPDTLTRVIVCRDMKSALSINAAFQRGAKAGWERLALDTGRARRYYSNVRALNAHACLFKLIVEGWYVQKIIDGNETYFVLEDAFTRASYEVHWKYAYRRSLGTIIAFEIPYNPPALLGAMQ